VNLPGIFYLCITPEKHAEQTDIMADQHLKFSYDSNEEDWDLNTLQFLNSQLESYVNMVGYKKRYFYFGTDITLDFYLCFDS
jgi:hypothetical protein